MVDQDRGFGREGRCVGVFVAAAVGFVFVVERDRSFGHVDGLGVGGWGDDGVFFVVGRGALLWVGERPLAGWVLWARAR